jgi:hypothetical protein
MLHIQMKQPLSTLKILELKLRQYYRIFFIFCALVSLRLQLYIGSQSDSPTALQENVFIPDATPETKVCASTKDQYPYYPEINMTGTDNFSGVVARPFKPWSYEIPCPEAGKSWWRPKIQYSQMEHGLLFHSPYKTGSTTAIGVHLRLAKRLAQRRNMTMCNVRYRHVWGNTIMAEDYDPRKVFMWTVLRDPTTRVVSQFFYHLSEKSKEEPTDEVFRTYLNKSMLEPSLIHHHYLGQISLTSINYNDPSNYTAQANQMFHDMNFIAVTERMDDSLVVLSMLLNVSLADVLYLKSNKAAGDFSRHARKRQCNYILPAFVSSGMRDYFRSQTWQDLIYWDHLIHQVANRSLDLTIDSLGRSLFEAKKKQFIKAKQLAQEMCSSRVLFPCSSAGVFKPKVKCLFLDAGCGHDCLDEVSQVIFPSTA